MELTPSQTQAADKIALLWMHGQEVITLAGPAGTGKTTVLKALAGEYFNEVDHVVVAPTNKAASVLRGKGVRAATLYSVFFIPVELPDGRVKFEPCDHWLVNEKRRKAESGDPFGGEEPTLPFGKRDFAEVVIADEASMLTSWVIRHLRRMCKTLILVGDHHQLPPVNDQDNPEGFFCACNHDVALTEVLRQGGDSPILLLAGHIRERRFPGNLVKSFIPSQPFNAWYDGSQKILAFTNKNRRKINMLAREALGRKTVLPTKGDILVCNTNLDDDIFNGTEMVVDEFKWVYLKDEPLNTSPVAEVWVTIDGVPSRKQVFMDMRRFLEDLPEDKVPGKVVSVLKAISEKPDAIEGVSASYGYCLTAHKAQGGEWAEVCVLDERFVLNKVDPTGETCRRWLYTAITRASEKLTFTDASWFSLR